MTEFIAAVAGVFFGAVVTFFLERHKENKKRIDEQHGAIVSAQLALIGQLNTVSNIRKQHLNPLREAPQREAKLISFHMTENPMRVTFDSIAFLLMEKDPDLVMQIHSAEQTFLSAVDALKIRNDAYEKLHRNAMIESMDETGKCRLIVKDPRDVKLLKDTTNNLYDAVDKACERCETQVAGLFKAGKKLFPGKTFLKCADREGQGSHAE